MTQDALAEAVNVSRQAVSHWETGRTLPDAQMLIELSRVLQYSFVDARETGAQTGPENAPQSAPAPLAEQTAKRPDRKLTYILGALVAALVVLVACLVLVPALKEKNAPPEQADPTPTVTADVRERADKSPEEEKTDAAALFRQEAKNEAGKAYLRVDPTLSVNHGDNFDYWLYTFTFYEMNGIALSIDRVEQVIFARERENVEQIFTSEDFQAGGLTTDIPANGNWAFQGGLPVQDTVTGVGVRLRGTDANGAAVSSTAYIPLSE